MSHYNQGCITIQYLLYIHLHRTVEHLGSGQFGTVEKGVWKCPRGEEEVAIKLLQSGASDEDRVKFLQEAAIMGQFRHPNVVKLHGVVTLGDPVRPCLSLSLPPPPSRSPPSRSPPLPPSLPPSLPTSLPLSLPLSLSNSLYYLRERN